MEIEKSDLPEAWAFKPVAEEVVQRDLSDEEYLRMLVSIGVEKMAEDVINPRESSTPWETVLLLLRRDPEDFAHFMLETLGEGDDDATSERWGRYIS